MMTMIGCKAEVGGDGGDEGDEEEKEAGGGVKNLSLAPCSLASHTS
ncbi:hypothetical protein [Nostoc sp. NIES-3756]|nr:hypothetical protein [Nostoc sp. NIES-3756]